MSRDQVIKRCEELAASRTRPQAADPSPGPSAGPSPGPSSNPNPSTQQPDRANSNPDTNRKADGSGGDGSGGLPSFPSPQSSPYNNANSYGNGAGFSNCTMDPTAPGCQVQQPKEQVADEGQKGGFRDPEEGAKAKDFNVADSLKRTGYNGNGEGGAPNIPGGQARGGGQGGVPNNTGGGIPGAENGPGARMPPQARGMAPQGNQNVTDVMQGFQGGGGYSYGGGGSGFDEERGRWRQTGNRAQARGPASQGMDLRQYLPGGTMDPGRRAGGFRPTALMDINASHVNIWLKIGDRLREKCRLGVLLDCR